MQVDAHVGGVNDIAFSTPNKQLCVITCGDDKTIKVRHVTFLSLPRFSIVGFWVLAILFFIVIFLLCRCGMLLRVPSSTRLRAMRPLYIQCAHITKKTYRLGCYNDLCC